MINVKPKGLDEIKRESGKLKIPTELNPVNLPQKPKIKVGFFEKAFFHINKAFSFVSNKIDQIEKIAGSIGSIKVILFLAIVLIILWKVFF